jgi:uncharacterized NAD(P)/FAD-binding protein YdhS
MKNRTPQAEYTQRTIAIVGGGVSGALTACHIRQLDDGARVVIIDPRGELGLGLAYSTPSLRHLLNVPAGKISALPDEPDHFLRWLREHHDAGATPDTFAPRAIFGRYIQSLLAAVGGIEHITAKAVDCQYTAGGATLTLDDGRQIEATFVVLATGNFDPAPMPGVDPAVISCGAYRHNAWDAGAYDDLDPAAPVLLIGTGLTTVDVLLRLRELGHRGTITAISRHGVFPYRHEPHLTASAPAIPVGTAPTCLAYLRAMRHAIQNGMPWRSVVDSLRAVTNDLWLSLPLKEQQRFRRHLQRRWDVVRHRMAPTIAEAMDAEQKAATLVIRRGQFTGAEADDAGVRVTIDSPTGRLQFYTARVINCTGPAMNYRQVNSPLINTLFARGMVSAGLLGGGLKCDAHGAAIDAVGKPSSVLFNLGPGRLGTLLESIAVPELRQQAFDLAKKLTATPAKM